MPTTQGRLRLCNEIYLKLLLFLIDLDTNLKYFAVVIHTHSKSFKIHYC